MKSFLTFLSLMICQLMFAQLVVRVTPDSGLDPNALMADNGAFTTNKDGSKSINLLKSDNVRFTSSTNSDGTTSVSAKISWDNLLGSKENNPSLQKNVYVMDSDFHIPQLGRDRKVWVYLPPDYETSNKQYPVIYMQDGQNLFTANGSFEDEWNVDETMNAMFNQGDYGAIIVAVENGGWRRLDEYSPWYNDQLEAGGEGKKYAEFLVRTLKPYVDATYRTLPAREYTCLIGSSMGALISHYVAMEYQHIFSKVAVLSPSFWFSNQAYQYTSTKGKRADMKYYTIAGQPEGDEMVGGLNKMYDILKSGGFNTNELKKVIHPDGTHKEQYWSREFGNAYKWLFSDLNLTEAATSASATLNDIKARPNADFTQLWIDNFKNVDGAQVQITSTDKRFIRKMDLTGEGPIDISTVMAGTHVIQVTLQDRLIYKDQITIKRN